MGFYLANKLYYIYMKNFKINIFILSQGYITSINYFSKIQSTWEKYLLLSQIIIQLQLFE